MNELELIEKKGDVVVLSNVVNDILKEFMSTKKEMEEAETTFRTKLKEVMLKNNILSSKLDDFTISIACPKPIVVFDKDKMLEQENKEILDLFVNTTEEEVFDIDKFKNENPDLYNKYIKTNITYEVDLKKLEKLAPDLYSKYVSFVKSDKEPSLRIVEKK